MLTTELVITIPGHPAPKGSLKCIGGRGGRHQLVPNNQPRLKEWRDLLVYWLKRTWTVGHEKGQPVGVEATYTLPRPAGHYGTGKNKTVLKPTAPNFPVSHSTGDVDKLVRAVLDALQDAGALHDDCAVVELHAVKAYPASRSTPSDVLAYPGVVIRLYPVEGDT